MHVTNNVYPIPEYNVDDFYNVVKLAITPLHNCTIEAQVAHNSSTINSLPIPKPRQIASFVCCEKFCYKLLSARLEPN